MFNTQNCRSFQRVGLTPSLRRTLIGPRRPNLTYMLVFPDDAARTAAWHSFGGDDAWKKLKAIPNTRTRKSSRTSQQSPHSGALLGDLANSSLAPKIFCTRFPVKINNNHDCPVVL